MGAAAADAGSADGQALLGYILTSGPENLRNLLRPMPDDAPPPRDVRKGARLCAVAGAQRPAARSAAEIVAQLRRAPAAGLADGACSCLAWCRTRHRRHRAIPAAADFFGLAGRERQQRAMAPLGHGSLRRGVAANPAQGANPGFAAPRTPATARRPPWSATSTPRRRIAAQLRRSRDLVPPCRRGRPRRRRPRPRPAFPHRRRRASRHRGSRRWFRRAAESGDRHAQADLANLLLSGNGSDDDKRRTRELFEQAAGSGDLVAAFNLGVCLAEGLGVERDDRRAMLWLRRAADGVVNAQYWYGRMLAEGRGMEADPAEGRLWIRRAADAGMADAQVAMAELLLNGTGMPADHPAALELFRKAAEQGHVGAMFAVAAMLGGGHQVPENKQEAQAWYRRAAEKGHAHAQMMLGRFLARGLVEPANRARRGYGSSGRWRRVWRKCVPTWRRCRHWPSPAALPAEALAVGH